MFSFSAKTDSLGKKRYYHESLQGVEATGDMARKTGDILLKKH